MVTFRTHLLGLLKCHLLHLIKEPIKKTIKKANKELISAGLAVKPDFFKSAKWNR